MEYHAAMAIDFLAIVRARLAELERTPYSLARELEDAGKARLQTLYNFFAGKPVQAKTLAAIFDALDLTVTPVVTKGGRK